jgi:hypothetical protein
MLNPVESDMTNAVVADWSIMVLPPCMPCRTFSLIVRAQRFPHPSTIVANFEQLVKGSKPPDLLLFYKVFAIPLKYLLGAWRT